MNDRLPSTVAQVHREIRAPRGRRLTCRSWLTEAAYRMIQNNLDPDVAENPDALVVYGGIGKAARDWAMLRRDPRSAEGAARRRVAAGAVRQAGRRVPHARRRAARTDRELEPRAEMGDVGALRRARPQGPDDVRPDDRRLVDLHRQPGDRAGDVRDVRRGGAPALRRLARWSLDPHGGPRGHGRCAAAGGKLRRRHVAQHRVPAGPDRIPAAHALSRRAGGRPRRCARAHRDSTRAGRRREVDRPARQRRGHRPRDRETRRTRADRAPTSSPTRRPRTISSTATCRRDGRSRDGAPRRRTRRSTRSCARLPRRAAQRT